MQDDLPPDPLTSTRTAMSGAAADRAHGAARRAVVGRIKMYLPRPLWPLIPGERGDARANLAALGKKKAWAVVSGCVVTAIFLAFFAVAFLAAGVFVAYVVVASM